MATTSCACFRWRARPGRVRPPRVGRRWSRCGSGASATTEEIMKEPLSIYVLVDALGWELVRGRPFLDDVLIDKRWLVTILGYSSGAIPSLLSGRYPSQHGHWNLFYRSPAASPFRWTRPLGRLPKPLVENPVSRRVVKHLARRLSGYTGYFSLYDYPVAHLPQFDLTEKRDIYQDRKSTRLNSSHLVISYAVFC